MDDWGWQQLAAWRTCRLELPVGTLLCIINGSGRGRPWAAAAARDQLRVTAARAGVRRRFAPHQLRHAHAVEMAREGVPLNVIQRQLGNANLGVTSVYLQGIDTSEIVDTVRSRPAPVLPANAALRGEPQRTPTALAPSRPQPPPSRSSASTSGAFAVKRFDGASGGAWFVTWCVARARARAPAAERQPRAPYRDGGRKNVLCAGPSRRTIARPFASIVQPVSPAPSAFGPSGRLACDRSLALKSGTRPASGLIVIAWQGPPA